MRKKLLASITQRLASDISKKNPVCFLNNYLPLTDVLDLIISTVYLYTRTKKGSVKSILMTEVVCAIGNSLRELWQLKRDSALAAKTGAFLLYSFEELGMLTVKLGNGAGKHQTYVIEVLNDDAITAMWESLSIDKTTRLPSLTPFPDWTESRSLSGLQLVKTSSREVLDALTPETHSMLFEAANRAQKIGWRVNAEVYETYMWALREKTDAFSDIWDMQSQEAKASKVREAVTIGIIAKKLLGEVFYQSYNYDFRSRRYVGGAYFHEQGTDPAKGLLLYANKKAITRRGYYWLLISIASNWAGTSDREDKIKTDKLPLVERVYWALTHEAELLGYANSPRINQGWMSAEKPWQFLAACIELKNLIEYQSKLNKLESMSESYLYGYESGLIVYVDGSNNGSQHLAALTKDEITAPFVNLVPLTLPGDLYKYVADHVWLKIDKDIETLSEEDRSVLNALIDDIIAMKSEISNTEPKSVERAEMIAEMSLFRNLHREDIKKAAPLFWSRITDSKEKRKVCKRGTMTLSYGSTSYGMSKQVQEDARKHGIALLLALEPSWATYMGGSIYSDCKLSLKRPAQLLSKFEEAGKKAEHEDRFLKWTLPFTNFPVVQHYTEGTTKKLWIQYGSPKGPRLSTGYYENTLQLAVCFSENPVISKRKQSLGASPNAIHSLDATHLIMTVCACPFDTTTIHDSFGCALADMSDLFTIVRETFVELYSADPLMKLMTDIGGDLDGIEIGDLNVEDILNSEYAFA